MPKKKWTPEEKAAFAAKMKAARQAKKQQKPKDTDLPTTNGGSEELIKIIEEMKSRQALLEAALLGKTQSQQITDSGIEGTREKFDTDPTKYPDYTDRLNNEPRLSRFGFKDNYRLFYEVKVSRYQRADGVWEQQPRFIYQLWGRRVDPDTGEFIVKEDPKTGEKMESIYGINQFIFHEDPEAFFQVARDAGLDVENLDMKMLQEEGRYMQVLDWLLGCFYPEAARPAEERTEMVIGNKLVEVKTVSVEEGERVKFDFASMKKL